MAPRDPDLRKKLAECEKEVKRLRFEEALAVPVSADSSKATRTIGGERMPGRGSSACNCSVDEHPECAGMHVSWVPGA